jgi:hypothetical protein
VGHATTIKLTRSKARFELEPLYRASPAAEAAA